MGTVVCKPNVDEKTKQIDHELLKDDFEQRKKLKFLLLGPSDAGKSTIVKQMRIIYDGGFNDTEVITAVFQIRMNVVEAFKQISLFLLDSDAEIDKNELGLIELFAHSTDKIEMMQESDELGILNTVRFYNCIREFFSTYSSHSRVPDNIFFFYSELHRILLPNYVPTNEDMLHMRNTTLGVHEISFGFKKHVIRLIDVGGQKTERRKWIHFFEGVTAVLFVTSLGYFDQFVEEDPKLVMWESLPNKFKNHILVRSSSIGVGEERPKIINRLLDSIQLFVSVQKNNFLHKSCFMLFLNKTDVLNDKLQKVKFADYFPEFEKWFQTDNTQQTVSEFVESLFRKGANADQKIYSHFTQAVSTGSVEYVFNLACDVIFQYMKNQVEME